jgi:hypothetical protein
MLTKSEGSTGSYIIVVRIILAAKLRYQGMRIALF